MEPIVGVELLRLRYRDREPGLVPASSHSADHIAQDAILIEITDDENRALYTGIFGTLNLTRAAGGSGRRGRHDRAESALGPARGLHWHPG